MTWNRGKAKPLRTLENTAVVGLDEEALTESTVERYRDANAVSTFICSSLRREVLSRFDHLRMIATRSTGVDHIDCDYCREHGIPVGNVPTYGVNTVAEHTFGLLMTISHKFFDSIDRTRRGDFSLQGLRGFDLGHRNR